MDKKEKDCGLLIAVLLVGITFGSGIGFVFGWEWHKRPGALSDVRILDVLIAIGTVGAVAFAIWGSMQAKLKNKIIEKEKLTGAVMLIYEAKESYRFIVNHAEKISSKNEYRPEFAENEFAAFLSSMSMVDKIPFYEASYGIAFEPLIHVISPLRSARPLVIKAIEVGGVSSDDSMRMGGLYELADKHFKKALENDEVFRGIKRPKRMYS